MNVTAWRRACVERHAQGGGTGDLHTRCGYLIVMYISEFANCFVFQFPSLLLAVASYLNIPTDANKDVSI